MLTDTIASNEVSIHLADQTLDAVLNIPDQSRGLVIFSHGSGSGRFSPRNNYVAQLLNRDHFATLLVDLLTASEDLVFSNRFDIALLTERLVQITKWAISHPALAKLPLGYFGASTGAASALNAAAQLPVHVKCIVSRGGRPDLAYDDALDSVLCPTLLIVGSLDTQVIGLNNLAFNKLKCKKEILIIPGATHLFMEPGKLEEVGRAATRWFTRYIISTPRQISEK